jgi:hypothetical protein
MVAHSVVYAISRKQSIAFSLNVFLLSIFGAALEMCLGGLLSLSRFKILYQNGCQGGWEYLNG